MKNDIKNRNDIELLVNIFYDKVKANAITGPVLNDIAPLMLHEIKTV